MNVRRNLSFLMAAFGAMGFMFGDVAQAADEQARPEDRPRPARQAPSREGADKLTNAGLEIGAPLPDLTQEFLYAVAAVLPLVPTFLLGVS